MTSLLSLMLLFAPAEKANEPPQPIEKVLAAKIKPAGQAIMVQTHILVSANNGKSGLTVKFVDVKGSKGSPNVHIKHWNAKSAALKAGTKIRVVGKLHFGPVSGGTSAIRYKVIEASGRAYNDHRHWRTDQAIYIVDPTFEIVEGE